jgi:CheY-like chemotaxis protein
MLGETRETHLWKPLPSAQSLVLPTVARPAAWDDRRVAFSVLVIDDDVTSLDLATRIVEDMGADVVTAAPDGGSALAAANRTRPDAALVDVGLPDRDGIDLAYELAALPWRPRVVLMSTDRDAVTGIDARQGRETLPFVPKEELAGGRLRRLLTSD